jgi:hypothetical protein
VRTRLREELEDVMIVDGVIYEASRPARAHQPHAPQQPELVRRSGFADPYEGRDVTHAQLAATEGVQHADAGRIAKSPECFRKGLNGAGSNETPAPGCSVDRPEMKALAGRVNNRYAAGFFV